MQCPRQATTSLIVAKNRTNRGIAIPLKETRNEILKRFLTQAARLWPVCWSAASALAADIDFGKPGEPVKLVIGYQPYYTESWSGVIMRNKKFYEKYLPKGSTVEFQIGLQGAIIVNNLLAGKQHIGYYGRHAGYRLDHQAGCG